MLHIVSLPSKLLKLSYQKAKSWPFDWQTSHLNNEADMATEMLRGKPEINTFVEIIVKKLKSRGNRTKYILNI